MRKDRRLQMLRDKASSYHRIGNRLEEFTFGDDLIIIAYGKDSDDEDDYGEYYQLHSPTYKTFPKNLALGIDEWLQDYRK